jgi:hypothetical protein
LACIVFLFYHTGTYRLLTYWKKTGMMEKWNVGILEENNGKMNAFSRF